MLYVAYPSCYLEPPEHQYESYGFIHLYILYSAEGFWWWLIFYSEIFMLNSNFNMHIWASSVIIIVWIYRMNMTQQVKLFPIDANVTKTYRSTLQQTILTVWMTITGYSKNFCFIVELFVLCIRSQNFCFWCKQDEWTGEQKLQYTDIPEDIEPEEIRPMGNYAVSITWPDGFSQVSYLTSSHCSG